MVYSPLNMAANYPLVSTAQYRDAAQQWLRALGRGENVSVLFFPKTDRLRRLQQLLEDRQFLQETLGKGPTYMFQMVDFSLTVVEDHMDIQDYIARMLNMPSLGVPPKSFDEWMTYFHERNVRLVLILPDMEKYLIPPNHTILSYIAYLVIEFAPYITTIGFYESDLTHPSYLPLLPSSTFLLENVFHYPLYDDADTQAFITYLKTKWNLTLTSAQEQEIITRCGGHFWFVKDAMRQIAHNGKWSIENESLQFRIKTVYSLLSQNQQQILLKLARGQQGFSAEEEQSLNYFKHMRVLNADNTFKVGVLGEYIGQHAAGVVALTMDTDHVFMNQIPIDQVFPRKEYRVLRLLLERKGTIVTREELAARLWPIDTDAQYSDWAIDQIIARVRKRLAELSVSPKVLQAVRGKGYILKI